MKRFGTIAFILLIVFLAYAGAMFGASIAGFVGEPLMIVAAALSLAMWGTFIGLTIYVLVLAAAVIRGRSGQLNASQAWTRALMLTVSIMSLVSAFLLAVGAFAACGPLWLSELYHWGGLVGSVLGFLTWFLFPYIVRICLGGSGRYAQPHHWKWPVITGSIVYGFWGLAWLILWLVLRGSINVGTYPNRATSPYVLPFPGGESAWVIQGNNSSLNHNGVEEHSWDFRLRCGTPVLASRDGVVTDVVENNSGYGSGRPNNLVEVTHTDGTIVRYVHIQQNSAIVNERDPVDQGDHLASVGNVGNSLTGHILWMWIAASPVASKATPRVTANGEGSSPKKLTRLCYIFKAHSGQLGHSLSKNSSISVKIFLFFVLFFHSRNKYPKHSSGTSLVQLLNSDFDS
jgi:hypothetical protein